MIKGWEELADVLAEFENRFSYLENSMHGHETKAEEPKQVFRPRPVDDEIDQLKSKLNKFEKIFNKYFDEKKAGLYE